MSLQTGELEPFPELYPDKVKMYLEASFSNNNELLHQATKELENCEANPEFPLLLTSLILDDSIQPELKTQILIHLKNYISRKWTSKSRRVVRIVESSILTKQIKQSLRGTMLELLQSQNYDEHFFKQLLRAIEIIARADFPNEWQSLAQVFLNALDQINAKCEQNEELLDELLSVSNSTEFLKLLKVLKVILKGQASIKISTKKKRFQQIRPELLYRVYRIWNYFNRAALAMLPNYTDGSLFFELKFNPQIFSISTQLDICLLLNLTAGFSLSDLEDTDQQANFYYKESKAGLLSSSARLRPHGFNKEKTKYSQNPSLILLMELVQKLKKYVTSLNMLKQNADHIKDRETAQILFEALQIGVMKLLQRISDLQNTESIVMYETLYDFLEIIWYILSELGDVLKEQILKNCLVGMIRVAGNVAYKMESKQGLNIRTAGILASPTKLRNFNSQLEQGGKNYENFFSNSRVREILTLMCSKYLTNPEMIETLETDPEGFIEAMDEAFVYDFEVESEQTLPYLANNLIEKLLQHFLEPLKPTLDEFMSGITLNQNVGIEVQDNVLRVLGMLPTICQKKYTQEERKAERQNFIDIKPALGTIEQLLQNKLESLHRKMLQRRFVIIIQNWFRQFEPELLQSCIERVVGIIDSTDCVVVLFDSFLCLRKMVKYLTQAKEQILNKDKTQLIEYGVMKKKNELPEYVAEELAKLDEKFNYSDVLALVVKMGLSRLLLEFKSPTIIWNVINLVTVLIEKCQYQFQESTEEVISSLNFEMKLLEIDSQLLYEAAIDMARALLYGSPESPVMVKFALSVLQVAVMVSCYFYNQKIPQETATLDLVLFIFHQTSVTPSTLPILSGILPLLGEQVLLKQAESNQDLVFQIITEILLIPELLTQKQQFETLVLFTLEQFRTKFESMQFETVRKNSSESLDSQKATFALEKAAETKHRILQSIYVITQRLSEEECTEFATSVGRDVLRIIALEVSIPPNEAPYRFSSSYFTIAMRVLGRVVLIVGAKKFMETVIFSRQGVEEALYIDLDLFMEEIVNKCAYLLSREAQKIHVLAMMQIYCEMASPEMVKANLMNILIQAIGPIASHVKAGEGSPPVLERKRSLKARGVHKQAHSVTGVSFRLQNSKRMDPVLSLGFQEQFLGMLDHLARKSATSMEDIERNLKDIDKKMVEQLKLIIET